MRQAEGPGSPGPFCFLADCDDAHGRLMEWSGRAPAPSAFEGGEGHLLLNGLRTTKLSKRIKFWAAVRATAKVASVRGNTVRRKYRNPFEPS